MWKKKYSNRVFVWRESNTDSSLNITQLCIVCWILCFHSIVAVCYQYVDPLRLSVDVQSLFVCAKHHHILHAQPSHRFLSIRNKHLQSDTWACWGQKDLFTQRYKVQVSSCFPRHDNCRWGENIYSSCVWTKDYCRFDWQLSQHEQSYENCFVYKLEIRLQHNWTCNWTSTWTSWHAELFCDLFKAYWWQWFQNEESRAAGSS